MSVICLGGGIACRHRGPLFGLAISVVVSFIMPTWLRMPIGGIPFTLQTAGCSLGLLFLVFGAFRKIWSRIVLLDLFVAGMVIVHVLSDIQHDGSPALVGLMAYGEWALPYIAGRFVMRDSRLLEPLALCCCVVVLILGIGGLIESVFSINLWEMLVGERPVDGAPRQIKRFGFQRAFGPTRHSIYFGLLVVTLTPWAVALWNWSKDEQIRRLLSVAGVGSSIAGIVSTVARGPILCLPAIATFIAALRIWWLRWLLLVAVSAGVIFLVVDRERIIAQLESMADEKSWETNMTLDGENLKLSSARYRILLFQAYGPAIREAGWLGYGSAALSEMPPRVPHLPANDYVRDRLRSVDNAYIFYVLRFGWIGAATFVLLFAAAVWTGIRLTWDRSVAVFASCMVGMIGAMVCALFTVWFSYDFGFQLLWSFGILAGLASQQADE